MKRGGAVVEGMLVDAGALDDALMLVLKVGGVASGPLAGVLHRLDGVTFDRPEVTVSPRRSGRRPGVRRRLLDPARVVTVAGVPCTDGLQTMIDLAADLDDLVWEQALESALRFRLLTVEGLKLAIPLLGASRVPGIKRMQRVLALRPDCAPATGSMLETLALQLFRIPTVPTPARQLEVRNKHDDFVAYIDLSWPDLGLFVELDGQGHKDQPLYDAVREKAVVAATGWLCARYNWHEIVRLRQTSRRRLLEIIDQARRRPMAR